MLNSENKHKTHRTNHRVLLPPFCCIFFFSNSIESKRINEIMHIHFIFDGFRFCSKNDKELKCVLPHFSTKIDVSSVFNEINAKKLMPISVHTFQLLLLDLLINELNSTFIQILLLFWLLMAAIPFIVAPMRFLSISQWNI